jgi:guanosine-3',5'-bis(diphosphate) 3'-pyrophosphohydrolase
MMNLSSLGDDDFGKILQALQFASRKHRDQRRKGGQHAPYINHPIDVTEILWRVGKVRDVVTLLGALLHDTIEDTDTSPDEIRELFGEEVMSVVLEVTDDKSLPKAERKRLQVVSAPRKSARARQIKLADKISNVTEITNDPPVDWSLERRKEYLDWTERVINGLRGQNPELEALYDQALAQGRRRLASESQG